MFNAEISTGRIKKNEETEIRYISSSKCTPDECYDLSATEKKYFELLTKNKEREIYAGSTLYGAHKDDMAIELNGKAARLFASQGQQRSLAIALKLAEGEVCREICGEYPVYLFDDVLSELDAARREYVLSDVGEKQIIITSCEPDIGGVNASRVIKVTAGTYESR